MENKFIVPNVIRKIINEVIDSESRKMFISSSFHGGKTTFSSYLSKEIIYRKEEKYASIIISPSNFIDMDSASEIQLVEYIELLIGEKLCNIWEEYAINNDLYFEKNYEPILKLIKKYMQRIFTNLHQTNNKRFTNDLIIGDYSTGIMEKLKDTYDISRFILAIDDFDKLSPKIQSIINRFYKEFDRVLLLVNKQTLEVYSSECERKMPPIQNIDYSEYIDVLIMILSKNINFNLMPYKNNQIIQYIIIICNGDIRLMMMMIIPTLQSINNIKRVEKYKEYLLLQRECYIELSIPEKRKIHII